MGELQSWLPTLVTLAGVVAAAVGLREQVRAMDRRLKVIEAALARMGDVDRLKIDVATLAERVEEMRDAMLREGRLAPPHRRVRVRTPAQGVPVSRDSDDEESGG